jgi:hypothetical protein
MAYVDTDAPKTAEVVVTYSDALEDLAPPKKKKKKKTAPKKVGPSCMHPPSPFSHEIILALVAAGGCRFQGRGGRRRRELSHVPDWRLSRLLSYSLHALFSQVQCQVPSC